MSIPSNHPGPDGQTVSITDVATAYVPDHRQLCLCLYNADPGQYRELPTDILPLPCTGTLSSCVLDGLEISTLRADGMRLRRQHHQIARARDDHFLVVLQVSGTLNIVQDDRRATLTAGDLVLIDGIRPYEAHCSDAFESVIIKVSRRRLRDRLGPLEVLRGLRLSSTEPLARVAARFTQQLPAAVCTAQGQASRRLADLTLDILGAAFAEHTVRMVDPELAASAELLRLQAIDDINSRLHDPGLDRQSIAARLGISVRYLSKLFEGEGGSVASQIRERRLSAAASALSDSAQRHRSLLDIAFAHGFSDGSHFGRLFKAQTGMSPAAWRKAALAGR